MGRFKWEFELDVENHANIYAMGLGILSCLLLANGNLFGVRADRRKGLMNSMAGKVRLLKS